MIFLWFLEKTSNSQILADNLGIICSILLEICTSFYNKMTSMRYRLLSRGYSMNSLFLANFTIFDEKNIFRFCFIINPLSANPTKCSNTLKQFFGNSVFNHFVGLALKAIIPFLNLIYKSFIGINEWLCFNFWHK